MPAYHFGDGLQGPQRFGDNHFTEEASSPWQTDGLRSYFGRGSVYQATPDVAILTPTGSHLGSHTARQPIGGETKCCTAAHHGSSFASRDVLSLAVITEPSGADQVSRDPTEGPTPRWNRSTITTLDPVVDGRQRLGASAIFP